jgi:hypothetical protein
MCAWLLTDWLIFFFGVKQEIKVTMVNLKLSNHKEKKELPS